MPPKRKPVSKAVSKPKKVEELDSPAARSQSDDERPITPLLERIRRRSGDGKPLDLNMSAPGSVEHGQSPAWKKNRSEDVGMTSESQSQVRSSVGKENAASNVDISSINQIAELQAELARMRADAARLVPRDAFEQEAAARQALEEQVARLESVEQSSRRKTTSKDDKRLAQLEVELAIAREERARLEEDVARIAEEKEALENQYDDALNSTLISFKSPGQKVPASGRKSVGRLSLSGYADEFASLGISNAELDALSKRAGELERIVERQAEEIERLIKRGSVDDSYDMEGLDQKYSALQEQLDAERSETTKFREEASRMSGMVESLNSERSVLLTRVRKYQEDELAYEATIAELESLQSECLAMRSEIETYKKRVFNADQTVEQLARHVETSKNHIFSLEDRLKTSERDLEAARYDNNALEQVLTRKNTVLNTELNTARSEVRKLRDESGEAKTMNHKLKQDNIDLSTNVQRWQSRSGEYEAKFRDAEAESKRARGELESIKRETATALRNAELREQELGATLMDNQSELSNLSTELRNVKTERDHLVNQARNLTDQIHEMKHSSEEVRNEMQKKHEADLVALRQKSGELESLLQSARREKAHYESQFKALQKQGSHEAQTAVARVKELEQSLEAQKKLNARLQREHDSAVPLNLAEQVDASSLVGKAITVLGSPAVPAMGPKRELKVHVSQPVMQPQAEPVAAVAAVPAVAAVSPARPLQRHPTAPTSESAGSADASANPLAFWRAKIQQNKTQAVAPAQAAVASVATTPVAARKPPVAPVAAVQRVGTTPVAAAPQRTGMSPLARTGTTPVAAARTGVTPAAVASPMLKVRRTGDAEEAVAEEAPPAKRLSMVHEVRQELEGEQELSPIMAARPIDNNEDAEDLANINKENALAAASQPVEQDNYMRVWRTALAARPAAWQSALSRVTGAGDKFQFGSKSVQCRLIGSDMLVIDGKTQMLVDRFLDQHGEELVNGGAAAEAQQETAQAPAPAEPKKAGLRFKNLRKQPLGHANDMESQ